jgi:hypothetical protein
MKCVIDADRVVAETTWRVHLEYAHHTVRTTAMKL